MPSDAAPGLGRTVLLVDDDALQTRLVRLQLELAGFRVESAESASAAVEAVGARRPHAVVSDVVMDELDGFALCRRLRMTAAAHDIPVVLISSYFDEADDQKLAREVGASALVQRTPSMQPCIEALVRCLAQDAADRRSDTQSTDLHLRRMSHQLAVIERGKAAATTRFEALFEHANDAVGVLARDGTILDVNRKAEQLVGAPREEIVGRNVGAFAAPAPNETDFASYLASLGSARSGPVPMARCDGTVILVDFTTAAVELDGEDVLFAIVRDVTELVATQRALEESERRYRSLVESIPDVVMSLKLDGSAAFLTPNVFGLTGFTAEELLAGAHGGPFDRVHPDDQPILEQVFERLVRDGVGFDLELRWLHRDGRWRWVRCHAARGIDHKGEPKVDGVLSDVTDRKRLEDQLCRAQKIEAVAQLTSGIAHDFKNVLACILANVDFVAGSLGSDDEVALAVRDIRAGAECGLALTSGLLGYSRIAATEVAPVELNAVVRRVEQLLKRTLGSQIRTTLDLDADLGAVRANAGQMEQVLLNLALNARDAMPDGGVLTIRTSNVEVGSGESTRSGAVPAGPYVELTVGDTGCGMDCTTLERIFEPFFTTKGADIGTGLGLSTSYGIIRRFDGHISVTSEPGHGTEFRILLPRSS